MSAQALECTFRLPLGHAAARGAAHQCPRRSQRGPEFVAIVKARAALLSAEDVLGARARASRAVALPHRQLALTAVDERPVNLQAHAPNVDLLVHRISDAWRAVVGV